MIDLNSYILPEVMTPGGRPLGFTLWYGRHELIDVTKFATPQDVPLKPGESTQLQIEESNLEAWDRERANGRLADAPRVVIHSQEISFGDGTGFLGGGQPFPNTNKSGRRGPPYRQELGPIPEIAAPNE